jgi:hypothetical protein
LSPKGEIAMRLEKIQSFLREKNMPYQYWEDNDCGTIEFIHRGLSYHIWEYPAPERGAESNVRSAGRQEDYDGDYEEQILAILKTW